MSSFPCPRCGESTGVLETAVELRRRRCKRQSCRHVFFTIEVETKMKRRGRGGHRDGAGRKKNPLPKSPFTLKRYERGEALRARRMAQRRAKARP